MALVLGGFEDEAIADVSGRDSARFSSLPALAWAMVSTWLCSWG